MRKIPGVMISGTTWLTVERACWWLSCWLLLWPQVVTAQAISIRAAPELARVAILELRNDAVGFTWVAARQGVFRYDGQQLVPLNALVRQGPRPVGMSWVVTIDAAGRVWAGIGDGLYVFTPTTGQLQAVPLPPLAAADKMVTFLTLHQGALWVGRGRNQMQVLRIDLAAGAYRPRVMLERTSVYLRDLARDSTGTLLAVLEQQGNWRLNAAGRFVPFRAWPTDHRHQLSKADGYQVTFPARAAVPVPGTRWALTDSTLLQTLPTGRRRVAGHWANGYRSPHHPALQLLELDSTWYWPGEGELLSLSLRRHPARPGLQHLPLPLDKEWHLWLRYNRDTTGFFVFALNAPGVLELRPQPWAATALPVADNLQISTRSIIRLADGRLLVGSYAGAFSQAADSPQAPLRRWAPHAFPHQNVGGLLFSSLRLPDGRLLVANEFGWFELITGEHIDKLTWDRPRQQVDKSTPYCVLRTRAGQLWGGGWDGLYQLDIDQLKATRYRDADPNWPLHQAIVHSLVEGVPGELWLATNRGLFWLRPATGELRHYGPQETGLRRLPATEINCVLVPHPDSVWVGTLNQGLLLLHPRRGLQRQLTLHQGLPSEAVAFVLQPPGHDLWVGTYNGLVRYDLRTRRSQEYTTDNGLASNELNRQSVYYDAASRQLYVGGVKGVSRLSLNEQDPTLNRPRLLLLALTQHHAEHDTIQTRYLYNKLPGGVQLQPGDAYAEVQVGLTDDALPGRTRYAYRLLQNGQGKWRQMGAQPWVRLMGLEPGDYTLEVKAETGHGQPARNLVRLPVLVRTFWWRRPEIWLVIAVSLALLSGAAAQYWQRRRQARREALQRADYELRQRLSADLHDEMGTLLTRVAMRAELVDEQYQDPQVAAMLEESRTAVATVRELIWSVNAEADEVAALCDRLQDMLDQAARASNWRTSFTLLPPAPPSTARLRPDVRHQVYLISKEAVNNALKHGSPEQPLAVELQVSSTELLLIVRNRIGVAARSRRSQGLRNMTARAQQLNSELAVGTVGDSHWQVQLRVAAPLADPVAVEHSLGRELAWLTASWRRLLRAGQWT